MKTEKRVIPALLGDPQQPSTWRLDIETRYDRASMTFSNRKMAEDMFKQIKTQGTFGGQWLTSIDLEEVKNDKR